MASVASDETDASHGSDPSMEEDSLEMTKVQEVEEVVDVDPEAAVEQEVAVPEATTHDKVKLVVMPQHHHKCSVCHRRWALKGCTHNACAACCTDVACERHDKLREHAAWKEQVLAGTTDIQRQAQSTRARMLKPRRFCEPGFLYQGDTVVIWNVRTYLQNAKWKEDAIRKSVRRKARRKDGGGTASDMARHEQSRRNGKQRFRIVMEQLYQQSLLTKTDSKKNTHLFNNVNLFP
jgi:hypothetical protein